MPLSTEWPISAKPLPPRSLQREPRTQGTLLSARLRDRTGQGRNIDGQAGSCVARVGTGEGSQPVDPVPAANVSHLSLRRVAARPEPSNRSPCLGVGLPPFASITVGRVHALPGL